MRLRNSNFILIAFCLYLATVGIRFYGITEASVQIDERHWTERSDVVVKKFKQRSFLNLTTHLGHPGVPPGIMMAVAQALSARLNRNDNDVTSEISIRPLIASRIASVLASSLLIPLLFLGLLPFVGVAVSFLAAALFSLDPLHISLSRQAHLDGFLTLFVFSSFILYLHAIARGSLFFKLLSGVLWGLAIATKPTAAPLVAILLVSRIIYRFISREQNAANTKIIEWSDIWTVVVGHVVFGALYTRLWFHESDYLLRLGIKSRFADLLYYAGSQLHTATILLSLILAIALTLVCIRKKEKISWQYQLFTLGLVLLALIALFPAVIENLARYWCWALGLSSMKHHAYGMNWAPVPGGYAIILLSRMPTLVLLFAAVGIIYLAIRFLFRPNGTRLSDSIVTCCILGLCIWLVPLSVSSKQTIRYAMPMIPALYVLSASGIYSVSSQLKSMRISGVVGYAVCVFAVLGQGYITARQYPDYTLFYSSLTGGISGAMARGQNISVGGEEGAIRKLEETLRNENRESVAMVMGDYALMRYLQVRLYPNEKRRLKLIAFEEGSLQGEYLIVFPSFIPLLKTEWKQSLPTEKIYSYMVDGVDVLPVFEVSIPDCTKTCEYPLHKSVIGTGQLLSGDNHSHRSLVMNPEFHSPGDAVKGFGVRVPAGKHEAQYYLRLGPGGDIGDPETVVANLHFSGKCERALLRKELSVTESRLITLPCEFIAPFTPQIRLYWRATVPLILSRVGVKNLNH